MGRGVRKLPRLVHFFAKAHEKSAYSVRLTIGSDRGMHSNEIFLLFFAITFSLRLIGTPMRSSTRCSGSSPSSGSRCRRESLRMSCGTEVSCAGTLINHIFYPKPDEKIAGFIFI